LAVQVDRICPALELDDLNELWFVWIMRLLHRHSDGTPNPIHERYAFRDGVRSHREPDALSLLQPDTAGDATVSRECVGQEIRESFTFRHGFDPVVVNPGGVDPPPVTQVDISIGGYTHSGLLVSSDFFGASVGAGNQYFKSCACVCHRLSSASLVT